MKKLMFLFCLCVLLLPCVASCSCEDEGAVKPQAVTVRFESHTQVDVAPQTVGIGQRLSSPPEIHRAGYNLLGWYDGAKKWNFLKDVATKDMTLAAKWKSYLSYVSVSEIESPTVGGLFGAEHAQGVAVAGCDTLGTTEVEIPRIYNGKEVVGILPNAFADNKNIKSVYIPSTVTVVGEGAFFGCAKLEKIYLEAEELPSGWSENAINTRVEIVLGYK